MIIPLHNDSPTRRTPYVNYALIAANVLVFLPSLFMRPEAYQLWADRFDLNPRHPYLSAYVTYAFLHANFMHIASNMLFLYIFGNNVNDRLGHLGYLAFYIAGGIFAGVAYVLSGTQSPVVGASGAIAAVTGAYLVLFPRSNITIFYIFLFIGRIEIPSLWVIGFFFVQDVFLNFAGGSGVAHMAHIGGSIFGFAVCVLFLLTGLLPRNPFDILALVQRWNRRRQFKDMVASGYNPFGYGGDYNTRPPPLAAEATPPHILALRASISEAISRRDMPAAGALYIQLRAMDPKQVLSRDAQLDIANELATERQFQPAVDAYEAFLRTYPNYDKVAQVELMLGLIYARYLSQYQLARPHLMKVAASVHTPKEMDMAKAELDRIGPFLSPGAGAV
jgi:membrane associated rhomboid family serine protease